MYKKYAIVIIGVDAHFNFINNQIKGIKKLIPYTDIFLSTSGLVQLPFQNKLNKLAKHYNIKYLSDRQDFIDRKNHNYISRAKYSQLLQQIIVSKQIYDMGYDFVFLNSPDIVLFTDFIKQYMKYYKKGCSGMRPLIKQCDKKQTFKNINIDSNIFNSEIALKMGYRMPPYSILWTKECLQMLYEEKNIQSNEELYNLTQKNYKYLPSDLASFDINIFLKNQFNMGIIELPGDLFTENKNLISKKHLMIHLASGFSI